MIKQIKESIERNFEKKLNRYYAKKTAELLYDILKFLGITVKYEKDDNCYVIRIKNRKDDAKYYKVFYRVYFDEAFETYLRIYHANNKEIRDEALKLLGGD